MLALPSWSPLECPKEKNISQTKFGKYNQAYRAAHRASHRVRQSRLHIQATDIYKVPQERDLPRELQFDSGYGLKMLFFIKNARLESSTVVKCLSPWAPGPDHLGFKSCFCYLLVTCAGSSDPLQVSIFLLLIGVILESTFSKSYRSLKEYARLVIVCSYFLFLISDLATQSGVPRPAARASPGRMLGTQNLRPHPRPTEPESSFQQDP